MSPGASPHLPNIQGMRTVAVKGVPIPLGTLTLAMGIWCCALLSSHPTCSLHMVGGEGRRVGLYHRDHCPEAGPAEAVLGARVGQCPQATGLDFAT